MSLAPRLELCEGQGSDKPFPAMGFRRAKRPLPNFGTAGAFSLPQRDRRAVAAAGPAKARDAMTPPPHARLGLEERPMHERLTTRIGGDGEPSRRVVPQPGISGLASASSSRPATDQVRSAVARPRPPHESPVRSQTPHTLPVDFRGPAMISPISAPRTAANFASNEVRTRTGGWKTWGINYVLAIHSKIGIFGRTAFSCLNMKKPYFLKKGCGKDWPKAKK